MTLIKKVFRGLRLPEQRTAMHDHCSLMHRLDRSHQDYFCLFEPDDKKRDLTIREYFSSRYGEPWKDPQMVARVQHYIKWLALQRFANPTNQQLIKKHVQYMHDKDEEEMEEYLECVRHALTRINPYQVRIFAAMLYGMCTLKQIVHAKVGDIVEDKVLKSDTHCAYAKAFCMRIHYYDPDAPQEPTRTQDAVCFPLFAPPSAMQFLMHRLGLDDTECQWTQHIKAGLCCVEGAMAAKLSFWTFWKGEERYCPLEQYASDKAVKKLHRQLAALSYDRSDTVQI